MLPSDVQDVDLSTLDLICVMRDCGEAFGVNWDPGAAFMGGEDAPFPDGYAQLRPHVRHVHFKDVQKNPTTCEREVVVNGVIDWPGALQALRDNRFDGWISVATHRRPKVDSTYRMLRRLQAMVSETKSA